jgi:hypothetical protein
VVSTDTTSVGPVLGGKMHKSAGDYTASTVDGTFIYLFTGASSGTTNFNEGIGINTITNSGSTNDYSSTTYDYYNGTPTTITDTGTATVASNGRSVSASNSNGVPPIITYYFGSPGETGTVAFSLSEDAYADFGIAIPQTTETYSNSVLAGSYTIGNLFMPVPAIGAYAGAAPFSSAGAVSITGDMSGTSGLTPDSTGTVSGFSFGSNGMSSNANNAGVATAGVIFYIDYTNPDSPIFEMSLN